MEKESANQNSGKGIVKNIGYNIISQTVALIVPLVTSPYIARVFNPELIGKYSYALANSSYFVLLECMGFPLYGQIKIAAYRDDKEEVSRTFVEIMTLKFFLMLLSIVVYMFMVFPHYDNIRRKLCLIMLLNIVASGIDVTWFLNGMEEFKVIAVRSISVRIINIISIFTLIKSEEEFLLYAVLMQAAGVFANIAVYPKAMRMIAWEKPRALNVCKHIKPAAIYFVPGLVTTIFSSTDKTMLGIMCNDYEVGIYEQANKISQICMNAISAIGNVLMPRAAYLYHQSKSRADANLLFYKFFKVICLISFPTVFGISSIANEFVPFFFGKGYEKSISVLIVLGLNVAFTALGNLVGQQCLISRDNQKAYNISVIVAAVANVVFNLVMIYFGQSIGAAFASVLASIVSFAMLTYMSRKTIQVSVMFHEIWKYGVASVIMAVVVLIAKNLWVGTIGGIIVHVLTGAVVYFLVLVLFREENIYVFLRGWLR